jgi:hypothetical protein
MIAQAEVTGLPEVCRALQPTRVSSFVRDCACCQQLAKFQRNTPSRKYHSHNVHNMSTLSSSSTRRGSCDVLEPTRSPGNSSITLPSSAPTVTSSNQNAPSSQYAWESDSTYSSNLLIERLASSLWASRALAKAHSFHKLPKKVQRLGTR